MNNQYDSQIELMRRFNISLQERAFAIDEYIESQKGQIAAQQALCEELKRANRSAQNASDAFGGSTVGSLASSAKALKSLNKAMDKEKAASNSGGLLSTLAGVFKKLAVSAASVASLGFSVAIKGIVGMFKIMKVSIGALLDLGKGMIDLVSAVMGVINALYSKLIEMAHELMSGGSNAWAEAIRETKMHFGALNQDAPNAAIRMAKDMSAIPEAGLSVFRVFGTRGELLKEFMTDYVKKMEATFEIFAQEFADSRGALLGIAKGMGYSGEEMNTLAMAAITRGHPLGKELVDTHNAVWKVAKPFGISTKLISRDVAKAEKNVKNFGAATKESLVNAVVQARILGLDFEKLDGLMGTFSSIDSSTEAGIKLFEAFEVEIDPYLLLRAQETGTILDHLRDQFKMRGVDASKFNRANAGLLASVTGLSAETAKQALSLQNGGKALDEIQSRQDDGPNKTKSLSTALKELADSIEFKVLSGSMPKGGFLDMWLEGLYSQMFRNKHFRGLLRDIGKSLRVFYYEGTRFFNAFMEAVPAARGIFDSLRNFFNPSLFKTLIGKVYGSFNKLFIGIKDGSYTFTNFMDDIKKAFSDHLEEFNKIDNGQLSKSLYDAALLTSKILGKVFTEISFLFSEGLRFIAATIRGDKTALNLISKSWKSIKKGFKGTFEPVSDAISGVVDSIGSASKDLISSYDDLMKRNNLDEYSSGSISGFANDLSKISGTVFDKAVGWFNVIKVNAIKFFEKGKQWFGTATKIFIDYIIPGLISFAQFIQWYGVFSALAALGDLIWSKIAVSTKDTIMRGIKAFTSKFYSNTKRIAEAAKALNTPYGPIQQRPGKAFYLDPSGSITPKQYLNRLRGEYDSFIEGSRKRYNDVKGPTSTSFGRNLRTERLALASMSFEDYLTRDLIRHLETGAPANQAKLMHRVHRLGTLETGLYGINDNKIIKLLEKSDNIILRFARGLLTEEVAAAKLAALNDQLEHLNKTNKYIPAWARMAPAQKFLSGAKLGGGIALVAAMAYNLLPLIKKDFVPNTNVIHATTIGFNILGLAESGTVALHLATKGAVSTASLAAKGFGAAISKFFFFVSVGAEILKFVGLGNEFTDALSFSGMTSAIVAAGDALLDNFLSEEALKEKYEKRAKEEEWKALWKPLEYRLPVLERNLSGIVQNYLDVFLDDESSFLELIQVENVDIKHIKDWSSMPIFEEWIKENVEKYVPLSKFSLEQHNKFKEGLISAVNSAQMNYIEGIQKIVGSDDYRITNTGAKIADLVSQVETQRAYHETGYVEWKTRSIISDPRQFASALVQAFSKVGTNVDRAGEESAKKLDAQLGVMNKLITTTEQLSSYSYKKAIFDMLVKSFSVIENIKLKPFVDFVHQINNEIIKKPTNYEDLQIRMYNFKEYTSLLKEVFHSDLSEPWEIDPFQGVVFTNLADASLSGARSGRKIGYLQEHQEREGKNFIFGNFSRTIKRIIDSMLIAIVYFNDENQYSINHQIKSFDSSFVFFDEKTTKFLDEINLVRSILHSKIADTQLVIEVDGFSSDSSSHPGFFEKLREEADYTPYQGGVFSELFLDLGGLRPILKEISSNKVLENLSASIGILKPVIESFYESIKSSISLLRGLIELEDLDFSLGQKKVDEPKDDKSKNAKKEVKSSSFSESFQVFSEKITNFSDILFKEFVEKKKSFDSLKGFFLKTGKEISRINASQKINSINDFIIKLVNITDKMGLELFDVDNLTSFYQTEIPKILHVAEKRASFIINQFSPGRMKETESSIRENFKAKCAFFVNSYNEIVKKHQEAISSLSSEVPFVTEFKIGLQELKGMFNGTPATRIGSKNTDFAKLDIKYHFIFNQSLGEFENNLFDTDVSVFKDRIKIITEKLRWDDEYKIKEKTGAAWNKYIRINKYYLNAKQKYPGPPQVK